MAHHQAVQQQEYVVGQKLEAALAFDSAHHVQRWPHLLSYALDFAPSAKPVSKANCESLQGDSSGAESRFRHILPCFTTLRSL